MDSFLTPEFISAAIGVIVILLGVTYGKMGELDVTPAERMSISVKTTLLVLLILSVIWAILYGITLTITDQDADGFFTLTSGIAGIVFIILSFIISREVIRRALRKWEDQSS